MNQHSVEKTPAQSCRARNSSAPCRTGYGPLGYCPALYGRPAVYLPRCRWTGCQRTATAPNAKYCGPHAKEAKKAADRASYRRSRDSGKVVSASTGFITPGEAGGSVQVSEGGEASWARVAAKVIAVDNQGGPSGHRVRLASRTCEAGR